MNEFTIEAQKIPGPERHEFIMKSFANLNPDESLVVLNSHDPKPLIEGMKTTFGKLFDFIYLEQGPVDWRVRFTKKKSDTCCGFCGG